MQPTIVFTAPAPGMIFLNGQFSGEAGPERALMAPVSPYGALYAEYRPLTGEYSAVAFKCVLSGGRLMPDSITGTKGIFAIQWPDNILEIEINTPETQVEHFTLGSVMCTLERGSETVLIAGNLHIVLPDKALRPQFARLRNFPVLKGDTEDGRQYLVSLTPDMSRQTGFLSANRIDTGDSDILHAMISANDIVGHGRLEQWMVDPTGLQRLSSEPTWTNGSPQWPATAEKTMLAAVEAALEGLTDEADNYFVPVLASTSPLNAVSDVCDLCLPMKYAFPESRPCIGLLHMENDCCAVIKPLYYHAQMAGGAQGPWSIDWISLE